MGIVDYLKETRGELHHVAWPTRLQTIVYTIIVIALSIFIALYLGFFDFVFTGILSKSLQFLPHAQSQARPISFSTSSSSGADVTVTPVTPTPQTKPPVTPSNGVPSFK